MEIPIIYSSEVKGSHLQVYCALVFPSLNFLNLYSVLQKLRDEEKHDGEKTFPKPLVYAEGLEKRKGFILLALVF